MNIDVIVSWPNNCDYPLWRKFMRDHRHLFNEVFVVFTQTHQSPDFTEFVIQAMFEDRITFMLAPSPTTADDDWRNLAVNEALKKSKASWVWFTEQDFIAKTDFIKTVEMITLPFMPIDVLAAFDSGRMHPCSIFASRSIIDKTRRNFGIVRNVSDHFSIFQQDLQLLGARVQTLPAETYFHFNGLSSNCTLLQNGQEPNYQPEVFAKYLDDCIHADIPLDPRFVQTAANHLQKR